jgi:hypothetical protein
MLSVGLIDDGFEVVGSADVGLDVETLRVGLLVVDLDVGLAEAGLTDGTGVVGMLRTRTDIEFLGHTMLFDNKTVPGDRSTNQEMSRTPELFR